MEAKKLITSEGAIIEITKDMLEDFYVVSSIYKVSLKEFIENIFDCKIEIQTPL